MSRTQGRLDGDIGYADGSIDIGPTSFFSVGTDAPTLTRNAKGDISLHLAASKSAILVAPLSKLIFRTGVLDYLQERFGTGGNQPGPVTGGSGEYGTGSALTGAQGQPSGYPYTKIASSASASAGAVNILVNNSAGFAVGNTVAISAGGAGSFLEYQSITAIPDGTHITVAQLKFPHNTTSVISAHPYTTPAGVTGPTPANASVSQLVPVTSARPKGISFIDFQARFAIGTANATTNTIGLSKTVYANAAALSISDILAATSLGVTFAATPFVKRVALTAGYQVTDNAEYWLEWTIVTPVNSTVDVYGGQLKVMYNFN